MEGQIDFFDDLLFKCDVFEDNLARPNSNGEVLFAEILDVLSEDFTQQSFNESLEHGYISIVIV